MASLSYRDDDDRAYEAEVARHCAGAVVDVCDDEFWSFAQESGERVLAVGGALLVAAAVGALVWSLIVWALVALAS